MPAGFLFFFFFLSVLLASMFLAENNVWPVADIQQNVLNKRIQLESSVSTSQVRPQQTSLHVNLHIYFRSIRYKKGNVSVDRVKEEGCKIT